MRIRVCVFVLLLLSGFLLFAGGGQEVDTEGLGGTVTLYTSVPQPIADKIQADFQTKFPAITLEVFRSGTSAVTASKSAAQSGRDAPTRRSQRISPGSGTGPTPSSRSKRRTRSGAWIAARFSFQTPLCSS